MKTYTAKQISVILGVDVQTVRRWCRNGKIKASIRSKKEGYVISESDLKEFAHNNPAYLKRYRKYILVEKTRMAIHYIRQHPEYLALHKAIDKARIENSVTQQLQEGS